MRYAIQYRFNWKTYTFMSTSLFDDKEQALHRFNLIHLPLLYYPSDSLQITAIFTVKLKLICQ
jgi:hypothetical protein